MPSSSTRPDRVWLSQLSGGFVSKFYGFSGVHQTDPEQTDIVLPDSRGRIRITLPPSGFTVADVSPHFLNPTWNLSSQNATGELGAILETIKWEWCIEGFDGLPRYLRAIAWLADQHPWLKRTKVLDVIDHSVDGGAVMIGGDLGVRFDAAWLAQPERRADLEALRRAIDAELIGGLRLLGCRTGCGEAHANLVALDHLLGVEVWGTTRTIDRHDFDEDGWSHAKANALVSSRQAPCGCADNPTTTTQEPS